MVRLIFKVLLIFIVFFLVFQPLGEKESFEFSEISPPMQQVDGSIWADSVLNQLTLEEKIAQLFIVPAYSYGDKRREKNIKQTVLRLKPGGVVFMGGSPFKQAKLTNELQEQSNVPLMIAMDAEWGLGMRLDSVIDYPYPITLGALRNEQLVYELGYEIARQLKRLGVHINFAPVLDINLSKKNEVINFRSFGEDKINVARKGFALAMGLQSNQVLAVAKHFPGHGSTTADSHKKMPVNFNNAKTLNNFEFYPFLNLIRNGLGGIMIGHLSVPAFEQTRKKPATLSSIVIDSVLKKELGFKGLVFTDALNMQGVNSYSGTYTKEVQAIIAGNDVLLFPDNPLEAIAEIKKAIDNGVIGAELIDEKCRKILRTKQWLGLENYKPVDLAHLPADLNKANAKFLKEKILQETLTLIENKNKTAPYKNLRETSIISVSLQLKSHQFNEFLTRYANVDTIAINHKLLSSELERITDTIANYSRVILALGAEGQSYKNNYGITEQCIALYNQLKKHDNFTFVLFGNPYAAGFFSDSIFPATVMLGYENTPSAHKYAAQALFGGIPVSGKIPVSINKNYRSGSGVWLNHKTRLKYSSPLEFGVPDSALMKIDSIVLQAIENGAMPGCQVLFAKNGSVVYNKTFGHYTYKKQHEVNPNSIYDLASVTKIAATTVSLIKLFEQGRLDLSTRLSNYLPALKHTDKRTLRINEILSHQSGLHSWIPFYKNTLDSKGNLRKELYREDSSELFPVKVTDGVYIRSDFRDSIFQAIIDTPVYRQKKYRYSDLGFYWMAELVEEISGEPIDKFAHDNFYEPLGMNNTAYNPLRFFSTKRIPPTEEDHIFRKKQVRGYVHDPGAAMLGGVSGHAGLFSNANDLAKLGQMLLNGGQYGGEFYMKQKSVNVFNKQYYKRKNNRRALGFDKPVLNKGDVGPTSESASPFSYGHSGFTGTYFWIDPKHESIYIFLSNRTYPDQNNRKLIKQNVRTDIQQVFYDVFQH